MARPPRPRCAECRKVATHLLLPQHLDLCQDHYRIRRPYTILQEAFDAFADQLTPAESVRWQQLLLEEAGDGEPECKCQPPVLVVRRQEVSWHDWLTARREVRLATVAGQLELVPPLTLQVARSSWPTMLHTCRRIGT